MLLVSTGPGAVNDALDSCFYGRSLGLLRVFSLFVPLPVQIIEFRGRAMGLFVGFREGDIQDRKKSLNYEKTLN